MSRIVARPLTLDGVMQAPGRPRRGHARRASSTAAGPRPTATRSWAPFMGRGHRPSPVALLSRPADLRALLRLLAQADRPNPFTDVLNRARSTSRRAP